MNKRIYEVLIVGGGPAGLTSGLYTSRERLGARLLEKQVCGGWPAMTGDIENYPGFPEGVGGMELSAKFREQAEKFGLEIGEFEEVKQVVCGREIITVETMKDSYQTRTLIIASGSRLRELKGSSYGS